MVIYKKFKISKISKFSKFITTPSKKKFFKNLKIYYQQKKIIKLIKFKI